jgi:hypothetical protein
MEGNSVRKMLLAAVMVCVCLVNAACGGKLEGTYSNLAGNVVLELRSSAKAELTISGEAQNCSWKADSKKVTVTCNGESVDFSIHDDGSLTGPSFVGVLRKSK